MLWAKCSLLSLPKKISEEKPSFIVQKSVISYHLRIKKTSDRKAQKGRKEDWKKKY